MYVYVFFNMYMGVSYLCIYIGTYIQFFVSRVSVVQWDCGLDWFMEFCMVLMGSLLLMC